jgi:hypothetical protein
MEKSQFHTSFSQWELHIFGLRITYLWSENYISMVWELHIFDIKMVLSQDFSFFNRFKEGKQ